MRPTILITGGTGFLGKRLAIALRDSAAVVLGARDNKRNMEAGQATGCQVVPLHVASIESVRDIGPCRHTERGPTAGQGAPAI